jgi:D-alanyl-D-alanine carboxypeptidase (penicillin-binding protein 5/6)
MKNSICAVLLIALVLTSNLSFAETLNLSAPSSILIDFDTGEILYDYNSRIKLYPASTTKMMTAILAVEYGNLDDIVTIDQEIVSLTKGSHIALEPGEQLTLEQLIYALMLPSANDAALAIAKHVGGTIENFVRMMNSKAAELGATDTNFVNPNGLHDNNHVSTAHDLALIGRYAMQSDVIRSIVNTVTYEIPPTNKKAETRYMKITNKLLFSTEKIDVDGILVNAKYEGASGIKTGYTTEAKNCLVSYAERNNQRLVAAVLKAEGNGNYSDTQILMDYGFSNFQNKSVANANEYIDNVPITKGVVPYVAGILDRNVVYPVSPEDTYLIEKKINYSDSLTAPITKGQVIGSVDFLLNGRKIGGGNIIATNDVELDPMTKLPNRILSKWYLFVFASIIAVRMYVLQRKKSRRRTSKRVGRSYNLIKS